MALSGRRRRVFALLALLDAALHLVALLAARGWSLDDAGDDLSAYDLESSLADIAALAIVRSGVVAWRYSFCGDALAIPLALVTIVSVVLLPIRASLFSFSPLVVADVLVFVASLAAVVAYWYAWYRFYRALRADLADPERKPLLAAGYDEYWDQLDDSLPEHAEPLAPVALADAAAAGGDDAADASAAPAAAPPNPYAKQVNAAFAELLDLCRADDDEWQGRGVNRGVEIYAKMGGELTLTKGIGSAPVRPHVVRRVAMDLEARKVWDSMYDYGSVVEQVDAQTRVLHLAFKKLWPVAARDFCLLESYKVLDDGTLILVAFSIEHRRVPPKTGIVRALIPCGGWVIRPDNNGGCAITYAVSADLGGSIPSFVTNMTATDQPLCVANVRDYIESHPQVVSINDDPPASVVSAPAPAPRAAPRAPASPSKARAPKSEFQGLRQLAFRRVDTALQPLTPYKLRGEDDGVKVFQGKVPTGATAPFKGEGIIHAPPRSVFEVVMNVGSRSSWDPMFKEGASIEVVDAYSRIVYMAFQPILYTTPRDVCFLESWRHDEKNDSYTVASISATHHLVPPFRGHIRVDLKYAGFHIERFNNSPNYTRLTYVLEMDPRGWLPALDPNLITVGQPLCIKGVRELVTEGSVSVMGGMASNRSMSFAQTAPTPFRGGSRSFVMGDDDDEDDDDFHDSMDIVPGSSAADAIGATAAVGGAAAAEQRYADLLIKKKAELLESIVAGPEDGWKHHSVQHGIEIAMKDMGDAMATRGVTVFPFPIRTVHWYVTYIEKRLDWDPLFDGFSVVEEVSPVCKVTRLWFKGVVTTSPRDFCNVGKRWIDPDGRHVLVNTAVEHKKCPDASGYVRGRCEMAGFVLEPLSDTSTRVYYLVNINPCGYIPGFVKSQVALKQPLCLKEILRCMTKDAGELMDDWTYPPGTGAEPSAEISSRTTIAMSSNVLATSPSSHSVMTDDSYMSAEEYGGL